MRIPTPIQNRTHCDGVIKAAQYVREHSDRWCLSGRCEDTHYGGKDRIHMRSETCPPYRDQEMRDLLVRANTSLSSIFEKWNALKNTVENFAVVTDAVHNYVNSVWVWGGGERETAQFITERCVVRRVDDVLDVYTVAIGFEEFWSAAGAFNSELRNNANTAVSDTSTLRDAIISGDTDVALKLLAELERRLRQQ